MSKKVKALAAFKVASIHSIELGGETVHYRGFTCAQRESFVRAIKEKTVQDEFSDAELVRLGVCDENGAPLFDTVDELANEPAEVLGKLAKEVLRVSGFGKAFEEELEKN